jgi:hypothetical protein
MSLSRSVGIPGSNVQGDVLTSGLANITVSGLTGPGDAGFAPAVIVSEDYQWNFARRPGVRSDH